MKTINCILANNSGGGGFSAYKWVGWNYNNSVLGSSSLPASFSNDGNAYRGASSTAGTATTTFTGTYSSTYETSINTLTNDAYYGSSGNVIPLFYPGESVRFRFYCPSAGTTTTNKMFPAGNVQDAASSYNLIDWYGSQLAGSNHDFYNMYDTGSTNSLAQGTSALTSGTRVFATSGWYYYQVQFTVPNRVSWRANSGARGYGWGTYLSGSTATGGGSRKARVIFDIVDVGTYSNINLPNYTVDPNASQLPSNWNFTGALYPLQYRAYRYSPSNRWVATATSNGSDYFYSTSGTSSNSLGFPANQITSAQGEIPSSGQTHNFRVEVRPIQGGFYANSGGAANNLGQWQFSTTTNSEGWYNDGELGSLIGGTTSYSWGTTPSSIDEGNTGSFGVNSTYSGFSTLYWRVVTSANGSTGATADFGTYQGAFSMSTGSSGSGTVSITPSSDSVPNEGTETFYLQIHDSSGRTNKLLERSFNVNDTTQNNTSPAQFNLGGPTQYSSGTTYGYSNTITISGLSTGVSVNYSFTNNSYIRVSKNSGSYSSSGGTVQNGDTLRVRVTLGSTDRSTTLSVGTNPVVTDTFTAGISSGSGLGVGGSTANYGLKLKNSGGDVTFSPQIRESRLIANGSVTPSNSSTNVNVSYSAVTTSNTTVYEIIVTPIAAGSAFTVHRLAGGWSIRTTSSFPLAVNYEIWRIG